MYVSQEVVITADAMDESLATRPITDVEPINPLKHSRDAGDPPYDDGGYMTDNER